MDPQGSGDSHSNTSTGRYMEDQLRKLWRAVEQSPSMVMITDTDGNFEYVNPKLTQVTGYTEDELAGQNPRILKSGKQPSEFYEMMWNVLASGQEWRGELCNRKKNGKLYWASASISPVRDAEGAITNYVGVQEDITERRDAREEREQLVKELRRSEETLRKSEELHRITLASISDAVFMTDDDGLFTFICPNSDIIFGYSTQEIEGLGNIAALLGSRLLDRGELETLGEKHNIEWEISDRAGERHTLLVNVKRVSINGGTLLYTCRDITERKEVEEERERLVDELRKSEEAMRELNASKDRLFSIISHDLRNPFATLLGYCELLQSDDFEWTEEEIKETIDSIGNVARRTYTLLENLLEWSSVQTERAEHQPSEISVSQIVLDATVQLEQAAQSKQVSLCNDVEAGCRAFADPDMVSSVVRNLLSNAVKFSRSGGEVRVNARESDAYVEVSVEDNGVGISEEDAKGLFRVDSRHTTFGTANERGTGLGLLLCKELVERNGGEIQLESEAGKGTTVRFTLPREG